MTSENFAATLNSGEISADLYLRDRIILLILFFLVLFLSIFGRIFYLATQDVSLQQKTNTISAASEPRPRIVDRNNSLLALNIPILSVFAEPHRISDAEETYESLRAIFPELDFATTIKKLNSNSKFAWLKRKVVPSQQKEILALGLPGIGFRDAILRIYPPQNIAAHVLGYTNIDNEGIAGFEKYLDDNNKGENPIAMSLDLRVQNLMHQSLQEAKLQYQAKGALGLIINVHTGEIISLASIPDYNPVALTKSPTSKQLNRVTAGVYEMGSVFKPFTIAMALESGVANMNSEFDVRVPIKIGNFQISDFLGQNRILSMEEAFIHSSNIAMVKMVQQIASQFGKNYQQEFLRQFGLLDKMENFELPEVARPLVPKNWTKSSRATISYGHGIATTPLQTASAIAILVNGGKLIQPTLQLRDKQQVEDVPKKIISAKTSKALRYLFWRNGEDGSGKNAQAKGYWVGGKTGTSEKINEQGVYDKDKRFNTFVSAFPIHEPQYVMLVSLDEPQIEEGEKYATAGYNVAPLTKKIIERVAPLLGLVPNFEIDINSHFSEFIAEKPESIANVIE